MSLCLGQSPSLRPSKPRPDHPQPGLPIPPLPPRCGPLPRGAAQRPRPTNSWPPAPPSAPRAWRRCTGEDMHGVHRAACLHHCRVSRCQPACICGTLAAELMCDGSCPALLFLSPRTAAHRCRSCALPCLSAAASTAGRSCRSRAATWAGPLPSKQRNVTHSAAHSAAHSTVRRSEQRCATLCMAWRAAPHPAPAAQLPAGGDCSPPLVGGWHGQRWRDGSNPAVKLPYNRTHQTQWLMPSFAL